jgi:universal stress protein A
VSGLKLLPAGAVGGKSDPKTVGQQNAARHGSCVVNLKTILVPTDFSDSSREALRHAVGLARATGAKLLVVHVKEDVAVYDDHGLATFPVHPDDTHLRQLLESFTPADVPVAVEHRLLTGDVASEILRCAADRDVGMIVIGSHGRTGLPRLVLGSVAGSIVRRAMCPVLTVKQPHREPEGDA